MALENISSVIDNLGGSNGVIEIPYLSTIFKALGGIAAAYLVYLVVNIILNIKKNKELKKIRVLLEGIDRKIGKKK